MSLPEAGLPHWLPMASDGSKIRGNAFDVPIAVAGRLRTRRAVQLLGPRSGKALALGAPCGGFGEGALGGRRERPALLRRCLLGPVGRGGFRGWARGWHGL